MKTKRSMSWNQILGQSRDAQKPFQNMKAQDLLTVMQASWWDIFDRALASIEPALVREVAFTHETWAHRQNFTSEATFQALSSIQKLLAAMSSPSTRELEMLKVESLEAQVEAEESEAAESLEPTDGEPTDGQPQPVAPEAETDSDPAGEATEPAEPTGTTEPYLEDLVRVLRETGALQEQDHVAQATRESVSPDYADSSRLGELSPVLAQSLGELGRDRLYTYQGQALIESLAGSNVAVESSWSADETLTYAIPWRKPCCETRGARPGPLPQRTTGCPSVGPPGWVAFRMWPGSASLDWRLTRRND